MPPPRKIDLMPPEFRRMLAENLRTRGFGDIVAVTEGLNWQLEAAGLELRLGKSAVGEYAKLLKDQQDAFRITETLLDDAGVEREGDMHRALMHMIASQAVMLMKSTRDEGETLGAKDLMSLGRMIKDMMQSAGFREKLLDEARERAAREARAQAATDAERVAAERGLSQDTVAAIRHAVLGV